MALMKEAMSKEDYDRKEKGLPPLKRMSLVRPEPPKPVIDKEITMADVLDGYGVELESANRHPLKNEDGMLFIGYDVVINLNPVSKKRGPGRPKETESEPLEPKTLDGWMPEGEFMALLRTYSKQIDRQVIRG